MRSISSSWSSSSRTWRRSSAPSARRWRSRSRLTLAFRALGAFIFGRLADRFGRRPILMLDVALYSVLGFATAFAPNLIGFLIIRALFGIAMGGEWGIGASLTMESVKPEARGFVSGLLQSGYPTGYLLASVVYGLFYAQIGWRGLFMVGLIPALLIFYIRRNVPESPGWATQPKTGSGLGGAELGIAVLYLASIAISVFLLPKIGPVAFASVILPVAGALVYFRRDWQLALYAILLMTAFNFFSHGTQDLYPTFLQVQHKFDAAYGRHHRGRLQYRRDAGRLDVRFAQPASRAALHHRAGVAARAADDLSLGLFRDGGDARHRRVPGAVLRAGRLGRDPGASQRTVARRHRAARSPERSISSAISSPRPTRCCSPMSPSSTAGITRWRSRAWPPQGLSPSPRWRSPDARRGMWRWG